MRQLVECASPTGAFSRSNEWKSVWRFCSRGFPAADAMTDGLANEFGLV
jgi:hypothetical protein